MTKDPKEKLPEPDSGEVHAEVHVEPEQKPDSEPTPVPTEPEQPFVGQYIPLPNLAGVATQDLVETVRGQGNSSFSASYINWARTMQMLREHAPGWMPETMQAPEGGIVHRAPIGGFLMIRFVHIDGRSTVAVPQAIMDPRNNSVPWEKITSRDVTDTQRRGTCMAAAFIFGLAYELWAKMPLESGYGEAETKPKQETQHDTGQGRYPAKTHNTLIRAAANVTDLKKAFALAWRQYEGDPEAQNEFKESYDARNLQLVGQD